MDKNIGKKLDGRYEITELIGEGGMADVYKAVDVVDNKTIAVKNLKKENRHAKQKCGYAVRFHFQRINLSDDPHYDHERDADHIQHRGYGHPAILCQ